MIDELIEKLKNKHWSDEVLIIEKIHLEMDKCSVRILAKKIDRSKSYVGVALELAKGLKLYPNLKEIKYRHIAYQEYYRRKRMTKKDD